MKIGTLASPTEDMCKPIFVCYAFLSTSLQPVWYR